MRTFCATSRLRVLRVTLTLTTSNSLVFFILFFFKSKVNHSMSFIIPGTWWFTWHKDHFCPEIFLHFYRVYQFWTKNPSPWIALHLISGCCTSHTLHLFIHIVWVLSKAAREQEFNCQRLHLCDCCAHDGRRSLKHLTLLPTYFAEIFCTKPHDQFIKQDTL